MHVCVVRCVGAVKVSTRAYMPVVTLFCFTMMISGNNIGSEGAKALAPSLGRLTQLTHLYLRGEQCNGCERKVLACMLVVFFVSGLNVSNCVCMTVATSFVSP